MSLIINGKPCTNNKVNARVKDNIVFKPGDPNTFKQTAQWCGVGLHWTGGENNSDRVIKTLKSRDLSVQFIVDKDGTIVQTADLNTRCAHMGSPGNSRFIGVETVCRGFATKDDLAKAKAVDPTLRDRDQLDWSEQRDTYQDMIGGNVVHMASFGPAQVESLVFLCDVLQEIYAFPRQIPARSVTEQELAKLKGPVDLTKYAVQHAGAYWLPAFDRQPAKTGRAKTFNGVLGHLHVHKTKCDPGTEIFYALWAAGYNPARKVLEVA